MDEFENEISWEAASEKASYKKLCFNEITGALKFVHDYKNQEIEFIKYYLVEEEDEHEIVIELLKSCGRFAVIVQEKLDDHIIENEHEYTGGVLQFRSRYLINNTGQYICWQTLNLLSGLPDHGQTKKYLFTNPGMIETLEASYRTDGSLEYITYKPSGDDNWGQDWETYDLNGFRNLQNMFTENLDYFRDSTLEPTNSI